MSIATEAKKYDPHGCSLAKHLAGTYWKKSNFIDSKGICQKASAVKEHQGILSVTFTDGSILCPTHWQV